MSDHLHPNQRRIFDMVNYNWKTGGREILPMVIAGMGAGKTTIIKELIKEFPEVIVTAPHDRYPLYGKNFCRHYDLYDKRTVRLKMPNLNYLIIEDPFAFDSWGLYNSASTLVFLIGTNESVYKKDYLFVPKLIFSTWDLNPNFSKGPILEPLAYNRDHCL